MPVNKKLKRRLKLSGLCILLAFVLLNVVAINHAYRFTHFTDEGVSTGKEESLTFLQKIGVLFTGITKVKSRVTKFPDRPYSTFTITVKTDTLRGWVLSADSSRGVIIMGHGYAGNKGTLLNEAGGFNDLGFTTVLFDFKGHGESSGYQTTIGYTEAENAVAVYEFVKKQFPRQKIYLYGISMGAVAMLRAVGDLGLKPDGLILECPYGSMLETAQTRFRIMKVPSFPAAQLLVFWGGIENGFWAFNNNSYRFAEHVTVPTLLLYGKNDERATEKENQEIYEHLKSPKTIVPFNAAHQSYCVSDPALWRGSMEKFFKASP